MGLFRSDPVVDDDISAVLLTRGKDAGRAVAKWQVRLRQLQRPGETWVLVAADDRSPSRIVAVAGRRVFIHGPGTRTPERVVNVVDVDRATIPEPAAVCLEGLNLGFYFTFRSGDTANAVAVSINRAILANRPRAIPPLFPDYFVEMLSAAGLAASDHNVLNLANKAAFAIGLQAVIILAQSGQKRLFSEFVDQFGPKMVGEDQTRVTDEMVDWLWARHPGSHYGLERQIGKFREFFLNGKDEQADARGQIALWHADRKSDQDQFAEIVGLWNVEFGRRKAIADSPC